MARGSAKTPVVAATPVLTASEIRRGIERIQSRIADLEAFNIGLVRSADNPPELRALETSIERTLAKSFGDNTADYNRFVESSRLAAVFLGVSNNYSARHHYVEEITDRIATSKHMLHEAINALQEELSDIENGSGSSAARPLQQRQELSRKVFIVHGHEGEPREAVAGFLRKIDFVPVILREQTNQGRTTVEKFEDHSDVGFAVVLLTPDDVGGPKDGQLQPRARQNVILELGYFIGKLGRRNVCAIKSGDLEIPSDIFDIIWTDFDNRGAWKSALARELEDAGHTIDWNNAMRP
jgi:predicted nucleotide-binding protein